MRSNLVTGPIRANDVLWNLKKCVLNFMRQMCSRYFEPIFRLIQMFKNNCFFYKILFCAINNKLLIFFLFYYCNTSTKKKLKYYLTYYQESIVLFLYYQQYSCSLQYLTSSSISQGLFLLKASSVNPFVDSWMQCALEFFHFKSRINPHRILCISKRCSEKSLKYVQDIF